MRLPARALLSFSLVMAPASGLAQVASTSAKQAHAGDGDLIVQRPYRLAPYDSLTEGQRRELSYSTTRDEYEGVRNDVRFALRKVLYRSDGLRVVAYIYRSAQHNATKLPVVIYNRGSYVAGDQAPVLAPLFHRLARAGFVVVAPQYRGSDGGEGRDEMGGADVNDVRNALRMASRLPGVDSTRAFLYGESRGGMMTYQVLRDGIPVRAAAVVGAFTDLDSLLADDPRARAAAPMIFPTFERDHDVIAPRRSALRWADSLRVPLLILHGAADPQVSPRQSLRLAVALDAKGTPYEVHVLAGGSHTLGERAAERDSLVIAWFAKYRQ
jgi:dipeptidyl aminopeptidase/acylaminoacyl peptidase